MSKQKGIYVVLYKDRVLTQNFPKLPIFRQWTRTPTEEEERLKKKHPFINGDPIEVVYVRPLTPKEHLKLREGSAVLVIDPKGFLRAGSVEYKPVVVAGESLELRIRYGKSERAKITWKGEEREGPWLVKEIIEHE